MVGKRRYDAQAEVRRLQLEVSELKRQMMSLRHSRRVLIDLLSIQEQGYRLRLQQFESFLRRNRRR